MIYRRKPTEYPEVEAVRFCWPPSDEFLTFVGPSLGKTSASKGWPRSKTRAFIYNYKENPALTTMVMVEEGDWLILNQHNDFVPCNAIMFEQLYEQVDVPKTRKPPPHLTLHPKDN